MLIAEELDADWSRVRVEQLPYGIIQDGRRLSHRSTGAQGAGGSTSIPESWVDLRQAGARARCAARAGGRAAVACADPRSSRRAQRRRAPSGRPHARLWRARAACRRAAAADERRAAQAAAGFPIDRDPCRAPSMPPTSSAAARSYGLDATLPGALVAVVERCPYFSGGLASFDASAARAVPGVRDVIALPGPKPGEPLDGEPRARRRRHRATTPGRRCRADARSRCEWTPGPFASESTRVARRAVHGAAQGHGPPRARRRRLRRARGSAPRASSTADLPRALSSRTARSSRRTPARTCRPNSVTIIAPMQSPGGASRVASRITGIDRLNIDITMTRVGGGFGRRLENDFVAEAVCSRS